MMLESGASTFTKRRFKIILAKQWLDSSHSILLKVLPLYIGYNVEFNKLWLWILLSIYINGFSSFLVLVSLRKYISLWQFIKDGWFGAPNIWLSNVALVCLPIKVINKGFNFGLDRSKDLKAGLYSISEFVFLVYGVGYLYLCRGDLCLEVTGMAKQFIFSMRGHHVLLSNPDSNYPILDLKQATRKPFLGKRQLYI